MYKKRMPFVLGLVLSLAFTASAAWKMSTTIEPPEYSLQAPRTGADQVVSALDSAPASVAGETASSAQIKALARGLQYDPLAIYNYVRNEIDYEPGRGIYTGATGCLQIGKGNDWDQCALLVALLRESGIDCRYVTGNVGYERADIANWLGVNADQVDFLCVNFGMRAGGITGYDDKVLLGRCWVEAEIDGLWKTLDPGFEQFEVVTPLDMATGGEYSLSEFLSSIGSGAAVTENYVQNLDEELLADTLSTYTRNLAAALRQHDGGVAELIWGRKKIKTQLSEFSSSLPAVWYQWTPDSPVEQIADDDVLKVRIQYHGIDETLRTDDFFGKSMVITYNSSEGNRPELFVNGALLAVGDDCMSNTAYSLTLSCMHPSANAGQFNDSCSQDLTCGGRYEVICQFMGKVSSRLLSEESARLSEVRETCSEESVEVFGSSMRLMELYYFYQRQMSSQLRAHFVGVIPQDINQMGVCGEQNGGVFFDLPGSMTGSIAVDGNDESSSIYYISGSFILSALEHGVIEQLQGVSGLSTARLLTLGNEQGGKTIYANASNWAGIQGYLSNYSSSFLSSVYQNISAGYEYVLTEDPSITLNEWTGTGYVQYGKNISGTPVGMIITGGYYGGHASEQGNSDAASVDQNSSDQVNSQKADQESTLSEEPVDLFTGDYVLETTDLSVGRGLPCGIQLQRNYCSSQSHDFNPLGNGWSHSLEMRIVEQSRPQTILETEVPGQMAAQIVQAMVTVDLMKQNPQAREWLAASMVADWAMDELTGNSATVMIEGKSHTFIQDSDGSYMASGRGTSSLAKENGLFVYQERNGRTFKFDADQQISDVSDPDGNQAFFHWCDGRLDSVTDAYNRQFTFNYVDSFLVSVEDSTARSVFYQHDAAGNLTQVVDVVDAPWGVTYDAENRIKTLIDPEGIRTIQNFYDETGRVTNQVSATANAWAFSYGDTFTVETSPLGYTTTSFFDDEGRNLGTQNALESRSYNEYDPYGRLTQTITLAGVTNRFVYDEYHNLVSTTNAVGLPEQIVNRFGYDADHQLQVLTNALGTAEQSVTEMTYTDTHHVDTITQAAGTSDEVVTDSDYDSNGLLQHLSEGNGARITSYTYDAQGNPDVVTSTDTGAVDFDYDSRGMMVSLKNAKGAETQYFYNEMGQMTRMESPDGTSVSNSYWKNGLLKTSTDARGKTAYHYWTLAYKPAGTVFPDGATTTNRYDAADRLIASRDALGNWTTNTLDSIGRPVSVASASTVVTHQFDAVGNVTNSAVDPAGLNLWSANEYDHLNRLKIARSAQSVNSFEYDVLGRVINRVDAASKNWGTEFDVFGRPVVSVRPSGARETTGFNALGQRTVFRNAEGKPMRFGVDAQGRVTAITNAIGKVTAFAYDAVGNLNSRRDAGGALTEYGYDGLNRLIAITNDGVEVATFDRDPNGNVLSHSDNKGNEVEFAYDDMNRLTNSQLRVDSCSFVVQNSYDLNGNRTKIVYPGGLSVGYHYGADNRLESVSTEYAASTKEFSFAYDSANRLTGIACPNGVHSTFGYDAESRITSIQHGDFVDREIHRNELGFKTTECINAGISPTIPTTQRSIKTHNDADQLISERVQTGTNWTDIAYGYNDNGGLQSIGSQDSDTVSYSYDYNNRLQSVSGGSSASTTQYLYDASGARIGRVHNSVTNYFVIDYVDGLKRPLAETDAQGNITRYYVWNGSHLLCHIESNGDTCYYHADELGSTLALTDGTGAVTDEFAYMPYGAATHTGATETPFQWLGGYGVFYDVDTELHLTLHRAYSCSLKRFISPDPLGIDGGVNVYMWANMNPLFFVDPYGLCSDSPWYKKSYDWLKSDLNRSNKYYSDFFSKLVHGDWNYVGGELVDAWNSPETEALMAYSAINGASIASMVDDISLYLKNIFKGAEYADDVVNASSSIVNTTTKQLQKKFKHAADFGINGNYSKANGKLFNSVINQHINSTSVKVIEGTYRGNKVMHYVDPQTSLNVMTDMSGNFVSGWKLSVEQLKNVVTRGSL